MSWSTDGTSFIRRSIVRGSHFCSPQFTHRSTLEVRKFWSAVYTFASLPVCKSADSCFTAAQFMPTSASWVGLRLKLGSGLGIQLGDA